MLRSKTTKNQNELIYYRTKDFELNKKIQKAHEIFSSYNIDDAIKAYQQIEKYITNAPKFGRRLNDFDIIYSKLKYARTLIRKREQTDYTQVEVRECLSAQVYDMLSFIDQKVLIKHLYNRDEAILIANFFNTYSKFALDMNDGPLYFSCIQKLEKHIIKLLQKDKSLESHLVSYKHECNLYYYIYHFSKGNLSAAMQCTDDAIEECRSNNKLKEELPRLNRHKLKIEFAELSGEIQKSSLMNQEWVERLNLIKDRLWHEVIDERIKQNKGKLTEKYFIKQNYDDFNLLFKIKLTLVLLEHNHDMSSAVDHANKSIFTQIKKLQELDSPEAKFQITKKWKSKISRLKAKLEEQGETFLSRKMFINDPPKVDFNHILEIKKANIGLTLEERNDVAVVPVMNNDNLVSNSSSSYVPKYQGMTREMLLNAISMDDQLDPDGRLPSPFKASARISI